MTEQPSIYELADKWISLDRDLVTKKQIEALKEAKDTDALERLLRVPIKFGTAGLRAKMEAGFSRMNCVTVIQASQGLSLFVKDNVPNAESRGVVIGHDHRYNSEIFAQLSAAVFLYYGYTVYYLGGLSMTPLVPFAVKYKSAACGIMITASHNPKDDNGYKVYYENGAQIIPPIDSGIASYIEKNQEIVIWGSESYKTHANVVDIKDQLIDAYFENAKSLILDSKLTNAGKLKYVYTAMHGVGAPFCNKMLETLNMDPFIPVAEQISPDPNFSTVSFPNPEEKGALDMAIKTANQEGATIIIASDPDADRFAAAEKQQDGTWNIFSGDQLGTLLAYFTLLLAKSKDIPVNRLAMVNSTVSSQMLKSMAAKEGFFYKDTLTGFKWMSNELLKLQEKEGLVPCFAYEEALGYLVSPNVLDKDGVTALGCFVQLAVYINSKGFTIKSFLDSLYDKYGYFLTDNYYYICNDTKKINKIFDNIRYGTGSSPSDFDAIPRTNFFCVETGKTLRYPLEIGGSPVTYIRDLTVGFEVHQLDTLISSVNNPQINVSSGQYVPDLLVSASSQMITFETANRGRITLRTSGTEPKIKYYIEISGDNSDKDAVKQNLENLVAAVGSEVMEARKNQLL
ncbi:hypothetical protein BB560_004498 [Smittium megazygosporum]|uniref:Phosphoglucomutase n=1 Tax=Smittium megazygosporum TaxID=133381 RepID=A0A2T9Z922_9FUNG|nr:hypothetical protein BB560_004498 [Smittium megazygosporum]